MGADAGPGDVESEKRDPAVVSTALQWQGGGVGGGGEGPGFSYLLELHMTYLAGSHVLRSWPGIRSNVLTMHFSRKYVLLDHHL